MEVIMDNILDSYNKEELISRVDDESLDLEEDINDESNVPLNNLEQRKLYVDKSDKSTSDILRMILTEELILQPPYQRSFVWTNKNMSQFIESLLLSIPVPTIFLSETQENKYEVIDGQQRLTTIFAFMKSKLQSHELERLPEYLKGVPTLKLSGLTTLSQYNNFSYKNFDDENYAAVLRKFNNTSLPIVIIKNDSSEDIKYDIFSRINSGSVKLNEQELLNVMYRGIIIDTLTEFVKNKKFNLFFMNRPILTKRFGYHNLLLRAKVIDCFINKETWELQSVKIKHKNIINKEEKNYSGRLSVSILEYLKEYRHDTNEAQNLNNFLEKAVQNVQIVFGDDAFKRITDKKSSTKINKTIAELQLVVLSKYDTQDVIANKDEIKKSFNNFLFAVDGNIFIRGTNNTKNVQERYQWGKHVDNIIGNN